VKSEAAVKEEEEVDDDEKEEGVATAGAQWEIFRREDVPALTEWLQWKWCRGELTYQVAAAATRYRVGPSHQLRQAGVPDSIPV